MKKIAYAAGIIFFAVSVFLIQQARTLEIGGTNPNLLLIFLLLCSHYWRIPFRFALALLIPLQILFMFAFPFFTVWSGIVLLLFLVSSRFGGKVTGNRMIDFLVILFVGSILFYLFSELASNVAQFGVNFGSFFFSRFALFLKEVGYNLVMGVLGWILFQKIIPIRRRISEI